MSRRLLARRTKVLRPSDQVLRSTAIRGFAMRDPLKQKLESQLRDALKELQQLDKRLEHKAEYGPGKGDPAIYEWELTLALRQQAQAKVEITRHALEKAAAGRYGICERCGQPISAERLEIVPLATLCIECARSGQR